MPTEDHWYRVCAVFTGHSPTTNMCGIAGYSLIEPRPVVASTLLAMVRAVSHRGPDDEGLTFIGPHRLDVRSFATAQSAPGVCLDRLPPEMLSAHRIGLAHTRFSIVDLSPAGHQPFWTADGTLGCSFNGEIYNYVELRDELAKSGVAFRTQSDTEVLLEAYRAWGEDCFTRFNGFWALALYDGEKGRVLLSRDRVGKAPLYVAPTSNGLWWCSEIKGIRAGLGQDRFGINQQAVTDYVRLGLRDFANSTFFDGITSFPRGSWAWVAEDGSYSPVRYWSVPTRRLSERDIGADEAARELRLRLDDAVRLRLRADVPMGFDLSGGLDSSSLVALAATRGSPVDAFTVVFPEKEANEESFARQVAERYRKQVRHQVLEPPSDEFFREADAYVALLDEPFHSPNLQTNQGVWRAMAARNIRVTVNGAAADEVLAGYFPDYFEPFLRHLIGTGRMRAFARELVLGLEKLDQATPAPIMRVAAHSLAAPLVASLNARRRKTPSPTDPFLAPAEVSGTRSPPRDLAGQLLADMGDWRMNYWLRSGNTSCMGVPIELRAPFLDYRVVEFGFQLPLTYLIHDGWFKWVLRIAMQDILPEAVVWRRRKMGFPFPLRSWLIAHEAHFWRCVGVLQCPFISSERLRRNYGQMAQNNPSYLWRIMSLAMWWHRCVCHRHLVWDDTLLGTTSIGT